jgi:hypothetical protein
MKLKISLLFVVYIFFPITYAQDSHYWNLQYGTKATLLGGAVIGSVSDLSATYYNPGAITLFSEPQLILSAKVYQYEKIKIIDGAGAGKDLDYSSISPSPTFAAFNIGFDSISTNKFAFSVLTRQSMNFEFETRRINNNPEKDYKATASGFSKVEKFDELWFGFTFAHKFKQIIGVGATVYVAYRSQREDMLTTAELLDSSNQITSLYAKRKLQFDNYRVLSKLGLGVNLNPITFGLTITTPSINVLGDGSYGYHNFLNIPENSGLNVFESNYQEKLDSKYKTSWAIGAGAAYRAENFTVHFSAEWYNAVIKYNPITVSTLYSQSNDKYFNREVSQALKSVINFGVGAEYKLNKRITIAGSVNTDFSANDSNVEGNISQSNWNIYHFNGGSYFKAGKTEITVGLSYSTGSDYVDRLPIFSDSEIDNNLPLKLNVKFSRIKLLFGFEF